jgi:glycosyltransferase involved in cell wall biosynthesis
VLELRSVFGTGGGPEKTILLGAAETDHDRFHVDVCYIRDRRDDVFQLQARAARLGVSYVEVDERHSFDVRVWPALCQLVRDRRIDIVHAHDYKTDALALLLARRLAIVPLATAHGWTGQSPRERFVYYPADKRILARYPHVIAVSSDIKAELVRCGSRSDQVTVILNSIDPTAFRRLAERRTIVRDALGFTPEQRVIGAVGRLERQKRFDLLIDALVPIFTTRQDVQLAIAGDGSLMRELVAHAATRGVRDRCHFLGHRDNVADLHHGFDLFVQSSEYEGTPNAVLEAMAMETPMVATDVGGTRELAEPDRHGIIVPKHDVPALTRAILHALAHPDDGWRMARAARARIEHELSFSTRTRRLERIYQHVVAARRARR